MLRFIKQKIKNQFGLSCCLLLGMSLLVAVLCCQAVYQRGSLDRVIQNNFAANMELKKEYPAIIGRSGVYRDENIKPVAAIKEELDSFHEGWKEDLAGIDFWGEQQSFYIFDYLGTGEFNKQNTMFKMCTMPGMEEHVITTDAVSLKDLSDYECVLSEKVLDLKKLTVGETLTFEGCTDKNGNPLKLLIAGAFKPTADDDYFWVSVPDRSEMDLYITEQMMNRIISDYKCERLFYDDYIVIDNTKINTGNIDNIRRLMAAYDEEEPEFFNNFQYILENFTYEKWNVILMFLTLELPIFGMILPFVYMVSLQIATREQGEIATMKSRGFKRKQILYLYLLRTVFLSVFAVIIGIPMGIFLCRISAKATDFLTFDGDGAGFYGLHYEVIPYALVAAVLGIICVMLPLIKHTKVAIVEYKADYSHSKKQAWEKYYLDVILMAVSFYLKVVYSRFIDVIRSSEGGGLTDPLVFLDICIFIFAFALFSFRIMRGFITLIYRIGRKRWKTVAYTSFLQITRTFRSQMFISIFIIVTIALGIFYANGARTMNRNKEDRIRYEMGTDMRVREQWHGQTYRDEYGNNRVFYDEPDFEPYAASLKEDLIESFAKVYINKDMKAVAWGTVEAPATVMAIEPDKFGKTAYLQEKVYGDYHWYNYLNALSSEPNGVLISRDLASRLSLHEEGLILVSESAFGDYTGNRGMYCKIVGIIDSWPGFEMDKYLMVVNLGTYKNEIDFRPYELWLDLKDGVSSASVKEELLNMNFEIRSTEAIDEKTEIMSDSFMIHVTNGLFSLSFLIAISLCGVGFLIYWIASIGRRELLFGVYRAMGISVREINRMLLYEQIFSTFLSVMAGTVVGFITTYLFTTIFASVYLPEKSCVPISVYYEYGDISKLFILIIFMIAACLVVLRRQIKKLNITQALKLGED